MDDSYKDKFICAFSSDYRNLYKADIYKTLSMPHGFIIHFRYKKKYVSDDIFENLSSFNNRDVIIFFSINSNEKIKNQSVRFAKITKLVFSENTQLVHLFMKLGEFTDACISNDDVSKNLIPPKKFLSNLNCAVTSMNQNWINKINEFSNYFDGLSFYKINYLSDFNNNALKIKTRKDSQNSYYRLVHGNKYLLNISIANPKNYNCKFLFLSSSNDLSANIANPFELTAQFDDISIPIYLKALNTDNESSFISIIPQKESNIEDTNYISEYNFNVEIEKTIGFKKPLLFGLSTVVVILSVWSLKDTSKSLSIIKFSLPIDWQFVISVFLLFIFSSYLYYKI
jgi:hypothetical protein